jgi:sugar phosphate isomerase/epimerase
VKTGFIGYPVPADVPPERHVHWLIDRARTLEVDVLHAMLPSLEPGYLDDVRSSLDAAGLEFETSASADYAADPASVRDELKEVERVLDAARRLRIPIVRTVANNRQHTRFTDPPVERQLENYATNLKRLVPAAEANGVVIAVENHCDYRGHEIARVIETVDSRCVRAALDTGNAYTVFDEPVNDARNLARLSVTTHLKDMKIVRVGVPSEVPYKPVGCALGEGHVDLDECMRILADQAPDPKSLRLIIEINWAPGGSTAELFDRSVAYLKERFARYLD